MTRKAFFPKNKRFWLLNLSCWLLVYASLVIGNIWTGQAVAAQMIGGVIFVGLGILGGLIYRYQFYLRGWHTWPVYRLAGITLLFVILEGVLISLVLVGYIFFLEWLLPNWLAPLPPDVTFHHFLAVILFFNTMNIAVFQSLWSTIYIAVVVYRRSIREEVKSLRLENALKEAQLSTLSNQLNPHFLFNALNNIRFMMHRDVANADEMITHLSDLLRYALESSKADKVTVRQELEIVEHYMSLAQIQFNERLNYRKKVAEGVENCLMPPMILQMLMENAIKHGMDRLKQGGELDLSVSADVSQLKIIVSNGYAEQHNSVVKESGLGIGLSNIEKRLTLLYGDSAGLSTGYTGSRFTATITLPREVV